MSRLFQLFVLSTILAVTYCYPFKFGLGGKAESRTTIGGDASANVGVDDGKLKAGGKGKGFLDWIGSVSGGAYAGDVGIGGKVGSSVGGEVGGKAGGGAGAGIGDSDVSANVGGAGYLDGKVHGLVDGDVNIYDADKIDKLHERNMRTYASSSENEGYGYERRTNKYLEDW